LNIDMNKCENCNVYVYPHHNTCPLCGAYFSNKKNDITIYPNYTPKLKSLVKIFSIFERITTGAKLITIFFIFIGTVFVVDLVSGFQKYSTTYVIPFSTILLTAIFTILAAQDQKNYRKYLGYLLFVFLISLLPVVIFFLSLSEIAWMSFFPALYSVLTLIGFLLYSWHSFREEIKKKLNF